MLYVLGLVSGFASVWFIVAALQTFADAAPARTTNVVAALLAAGLAAAFFWMARGLGGARAREAAEAGADGSWAAPGAHTRTEQDLRPTSRS